MLSRVSQYYAECFFFHIIFSYFKFLPLSNIFPYLTQHQSYFINYFILFIYLFFLRNIFFVKFKFHYALSHYVYASCPSPS